MLNINTDTTKIWSENETLRSMFGKAVTDFAKNDKDIVLLVADSGRMCKADYFVKECPDQYIDCGIAEQNMIGVAAGLAHSGKKPFAFAFSPFITERCFEQIKIDIAYIGLNVILVGADGGFSKATLGVTHYGLEDCALIRSLPGFKIFSPADNAELIKCMEAALKISGPTYIRLTGGAGKPVAIYRDDYEFVPGKGIVLREGEDVAIIGSGTIVDDALKAAALLEKEHISASVIDMHTVKPIDREMIIKMAKKTRLIVSAEEHNVIGSLSSAIAETIACEGIPCRLIRIGVPDEYPDHVSHYATMAKKYGLTPDGIAEAVKRALNR